MKYTTKLEPIEGVDFCVYVDEQGESFVDLGQLQHRFRKLKIFRNMEKDATRELPGFSPLDLVLFSKVRAKLEEYHCDLPQ